MHILTLDKVKYFFEFNGIKLRSSEMLSETKVDNIFVDASNYGLAFVAFVSFGVFNAEQTGLETNYDSWDELYDCYCNFIVGYAGNKC
jgi:hypothetical protein